MFKNIRNFSRTLCLPKTMLECSLLSIASVFFMSVSVSLLTQCSEVTVVSTVERFHEVFRLPASCVAGTDKILCSPGTLYTNQV